MPKSPARDHYGRAAGRPVRGSVLVKWRLTEKKPTPDYGTRQPKRWPVWVWVLIAVILCAAVAATLSARRAAESRRQELIAELRLRAIQATRSAAPATQRGSARQPMREPPQAH